MMITLEKLTEMAHEVMFFNEPSNESTGLSRVITNKGNLECFVKIKNNKTTIRYYLKNKVISKKNLIEIFPSLEVTG